MFSVLTEPNYPKAAIGLEREAVTALLLQKEGRGQFGVRQAATIDLPVNLLTPSFVERNIASAEELRVILEDAVVSAGLVVPGEDFPIGPSLSLCPFPERAIDIAASGRAPARQAVSSQADPGA